MRKKSRVLPLLLAVVVFLVAFPPMSASAAELYFTGINDSITPLTSDTMPCRYGGILYVPYTVFNPSQNGIGVSLGLNASYSSHGGQSVNIYNLRQILTFDITNGTCRDEMSGVAYEGRAIMRNGKPYVPLNTVCSFFGLEYSYNQLPYISQGYLVRIKSAETVLDDTTFIDNARWLINNRLRDYTQSLSSAETTPTPATNPTAPAEIDGGDVAVYLAFCCESAEGLPSILSTLDSTGQYALFFLTPQVIEQEGDLVRRILGTGHSIGILARNGEEEALNRGRLALEELAHTRTTLAYVPDGSRAELEEQGWVCWSETLYLEPSDTVGGSAFAGTVLNRLSTRRRTVCLTLEGGGNTARILSALLRQLSGSNYIVAIPMETKL